MSKYSYGSFMVTHEDGVTFAAIPPTGAFPAPRYSTTEINRAARFESWGDASDASQNFGPEWSVKEV